MDKKRLSAFLMTIILPNVISELNIIDGNEKYSIDKLYRSKLFELLSDPKTGLWHLSAVTLAQMYQDELISGEFEVPQEQS